MVVEGGWTRMAAPHGCPSHEMLGNEEGSDHTMPGGHGVVTPGCRWHGACMERPSIHHNTPHCAQVSVWRLGGSAGQGSARALNLWPSCYTQRQTNQRRQRREQPHTVAAGVPWAIYLDRVATVPGPVRWHGVERVCGDVHQPKVAISGSRVPMPHIPAQMAVGRNQVCVWDGREAQKQKD